MPILDKYKNDINQLCLMHKVRKLYAFGSVLREDFNNGSDIDLIVDFEPLEVSMYAENYFQLKSSLQNTLKRNIDLLEERTIKNPYFRQVVDQQRQLIYGH